ncbi:MAG: hypothetical protein QOF08_577, partial [Gaiellales bacterium]|nr:hypothetical protein [Gaiellales bacterium]
RSSLVTAALVAGAGAGAAGIASAASGGSTAATGSSGTAATHQGAGANPATVSHGPGETLLTGSAAASAKQAALAAVPGATVIRVETDSSGAAYEAHLTKADGSYVTVKMNSSFKVTDTVSGFGGPPPSGAAQ